MMNKESLSQINISEIRDKTFAQIPVGSELLSVRDGNSEMENFTNKDIENMIDFICSS